MHGALVLDPQTATQQTGGDRCGENADQNEQGLDAEELGALVIVERQFRAQSPMWNLINGVK